MKRHLFLAPLFLLLLAPACRRRVVPAPATPPRDWYEASEIEAAARPYSDNPLPQFSDSAALAALRTTQAVRVEYVVDKDGTVDAGTFRNLTPDAHPGVVAAIRAAVLRWGYRPAWDRGHAVRMIVRQTFEFVDRPRR